MVEAVARVERRGLITLLNIHPLLQAVSQPCTARRMHSNCNKCIYAERYLETDELNAKKVLHTDERTGKPKYKKWVKVLLSVKKKMIALQW